MKKAKTILIKNNTPLSTAVMIAFFIIMKHTPVNAAETASPRIFCGGVSGIEALAGPSNSDRFRADGGAIYLHHSGWSSDRLTNAQRDDIIQNVWHGRQFGIELGFNDANVTTWQNAYESWYHNRGIRPAFITCNAFSSDRIPDVTHWKNSIQAYREKGVTGPIYATFEYANFPGNMTTLMQNLVSDRTDFQNIIKASGGMTIDVPPAVYYRRLNDSNPAVRKYKDWILDAVKWAKSNGHTVGIIVSPNSSKTKYDEDTKKIVIELQTEDALPHFFIVENYSTEDPSTYDNEVGNEDTPHHQLGCARMLQMYFDPTPIKPVIFPPMSTGSDIIKRTIYTVTGETVHEGIYGPQQFGEYSRHWNAWGATKHSVSPGVYLSIVTLEDGTVMVDRKMVRLW